MHPPHSEGFSLAEVLVAVALLVLLAGLALGTYAAARRAVGAYEARLALFSAAEGLRHRLALDLVRAEALVPAAPDSLVLALGNGRRVGYGWTGSALSRGGVPVGSATVAVESFVVTALPPDAARAGSPPVAEVRAVLRVRERSQRVRVRAALRAPAAWPENTAAP